MVNSNDWPDEDAREETFSDLSEQEAQDLYETAFEVYRQVSKGKAPEELLDDFEEFLAVVKNTREQH